MYELEYILFCSEKTDFKLLVGYFLKAILNGKTHLSEKTRVFLCVSSSYQYSLNVTRTEDTEICQKAQSFVLS